tara:strand:- start:367 stop:561 length:195 start_codon:yes stop_codon:yes gene_type:complete
VDVEALIMAFALIVVVDGQRLEDTWLFKDITRCQYFADRIEKKELRITAYCLPNWTPQGSKFND